MTTEQNPPRPVADEFVIPTREEFLRTLDLANPALASVKIALDGGDVDVAGREFIQHFRTRGVDTMRCGITGPRTQTT